MTHRSFPSDFLWGVASAGHQNEGDNTNSDTWFLENVDADGLPEPSGRACNSCELWREDLDLAAGMGLNAYRFSVEWARIEPVRGRVRRRGARPLRGDRRPLPRARLAPVVTFNHFTSPHWFAMRGGWLTPRRRSCSRATATASCSASATGSPTPSRMNEPNLARLLTWLDLPDFVRDLERATLEAASRGDGRAGVPGWPT